MIRRPSSVVRRLWSVVRGLGSTRVDNVPSHHSHYHFHFPDFFRGNSPDVLLQQNKISKFAFFKRSFFFFFERSICCIVSIGLQCLFNRNPLFRKPSVWIFII